MTMPNEGTGRTTRSLRLALSILDEHREGTVVFVIHRWEFVSAVERLFRRILGKRSPEWTTPRQGCFQRGNLRLEIVTPDKALEGLRPLATIQDHHLWTSKL